MSSTAGKSDFYKTATNNDGELLQSAYYKPEVEHVAPQIVRSSFGNSHQQSTRQRRADGADAAVRHHQLQHLQLLGSKEVSLHVQS